MCRRGERFRHGTVNRSRTGPSATRPPEFLVTHNSTPESGTTRSDSDQFARHLTVDPGKFYGTVRESMNATVDTHGHHPEGDYTPAAWRHYTRRRALLDRLKDIQFSSALDVGCAEGYFMHAIGEARGAAMWGVDLSDHAASQASSRYGFRAAAAEATALPFADGTFDLVYSTEVIEHVLEPASMLAEMRRVSRGYVLVTTPVSQTPDEHEPDYAVRSEGHVNNFDEPTMRRLFGSDADLRTFRCNGTFAMVTAFGRKLPPAPREFFYKLDLMAAKRFGRPHHPFKPLRNRDWIIVTRGSATEAGVQEWRCPHCRGSLTETEQALECESEGLRFAFAAPGVPDFVDPALSRPSSA